MTLIENEKLASNSIFTGSDLCSKKSMLIFRGRKALHRQIEKRWLRLGSGNHLEAWMNEEENEEEEGG